MIKLSRNFFMMLLMTILLMSMPCISYAETDFLTDNSTTTKLNPAEINLGRINLDSSIKLNNNENYSAALPLENNLKLQFSNLAKANLLACLSNSPDSANSEIINHELSTFEEIIQKQIINFTNDNQRHCFKIQSQTENLEMPLSIENNLKQTFLDLVLNSEINQSSDLQITRNDIDVSGINPTEISTDINTESPTNIQITEFKIDYQIIKSEESASVVEFMLSEMPLGLLTIFVSDDNEINFNVINNEPIKISHEFLSPGLYLVSATLSQDNKVIALSNTLNINLEDSSTPLPVPNPIITDPILDPVTPPPTEDPILVIPNPSSPTDPIVIIPDPSPDPIIFNPVPTPAPPNQPPSPTPPTNTGIPSPSPTPQIFADEDDEDLFEGIDDEDFFNDDAGSAPEQVSEKCDPKDYIQYALANEIDFIEQEVTKFLENFINKFIPALRADSRGGKTIIYTIEDTKNILREYITSLEKSSTNFKIRFFAIKRLEKAYECAGSYPSKDKPSPRVPIIKSEIQSAIAKDKLALEQLKEFIESLKAIIDQINNIMISSERDRKALDVNFKVLLGYEKGSVVYSIKQFAKVIKLIEEANQNKVNAFYNADGEYPLKYPNYSFTLLKLPHSISTLGTDKNRPTNKDIFYCDPKPFILMAHNGTDSDKEANYEFTAYKYIYEELNQPLITIINKVTEIVLSNTDQTRVTKIQKERIKNEVIPVAKSLEDNLSGSFLKIGKQNILRAYICADDKGASQTKEEMRLNHDEYYRKTQLAFDYGIAFEIHSLVRYLKTYDSIPENSNSFDKRTQAYFFPRNIAEKIIEIDNYRDKIVENLEEATKHNKKAYSLESGNQADLKNLEPKSIELAKDLYKAVNDNSKLLSNRTKEAAIAHAQNPEKAQAAQKINYKNKCNPTKDIVRAHKSKPVSERYTNNEYNTMLFLETIIDEFTDIISDLDFDIAFIDPNQERNFKHADIKSIKQRSTILNNKLKSRKNILSEANLNLNEALTCIKNDHKGVRAPDLVSAQDYDQKTAKEFSDLINSLDRFINYLNDIEIYSHITDVPAFKKKYLEEILVFSAFDGDFNLMSAYLKSATELKRGVYIFYQGENAYQIFNTPIELDASLDVLNSTYNLIKVNNENLVEELINEGKL